MQKVTPSRVTCWALVVLSMALVGWIRLLPQSLGSADDRADLIARRQLQERLTSELPADVAASRQLAHADEQAEEWILRHPAQFEAERTAIAQRLRAALTYTGDDGREHVYLGDFDSYLWLRHARNYLRTGTACDAMVDGACRDTYSNAPVGARSIYARSWHVAAIAGLHDLIARFRPTYPLPATAFLVPVIAGVLGVLPAFFIARGLAGTTAGVFAGVLSAVHPIVLTRTIGSDNDVWQVVLPLYVVWAALAALAAATSPISSLHAALDDRDQEGNTTLLVTTNLKTRDPVDPPDEPDLPGIKLPTRAYATHCSDRRTTWDLRRLSRAIRPLHRQNPARSSQPIRPAARQARTHHRDHTDNQW